MIKKIVALLCCISSIALHAQTGIGTTTPDASAKLEVSATNKGFLPPRLALTATNSASPITSPANGLMVFNTVTAGTNPYQVVPGYYYWDATGLKWVSLSTTVGNVQNQGVFRSTGSTTAGAPVSTWNSRFNNIAAADLTVTSNTTFALSNGIYKLEWALPYQQSSTYNLMVLQENNSGSWANFLNDYGYAAIGNGGNSDWGGGTFATDIVDCSSSTRTFRLINADGSRGLYYGANFIITKLNPAITTSTTADNLGNHTATKNINLSGNYISNDGSNEGIRIDNSGNVGINTATPTVPLEVNGAVNASSLSLSNSIIGTPSLVLRNGDAASSYSDIAQIKMGWSSSATGKSQYAQFIHTRHNSGNTLNAIDFYLSDGTADNTITTGSTKAMTIESPGNLTVSGKLTIGNASGNVATKVSGFVDAGTFLSMDNLKVTMGSSSTARSLVIAAVSTNFTANVTAWIGYTGGGGGSSQRNISMTTTNTTSFNGWGLNNEGDGAQYNILDLTNSRFYRVTLMTGFNFNNNFISIERLL